MTRAKRPPEERAEAAKKRDEKIAARIKRQADKPSRWPGFALFWQHFPHPPAGVNVQLLMKIFARYAWDLQRPDFETLKAILRACLTPGGTHDDQGIPMLAGTWLDESRWLPSDQRPPTMAQRCAVEMAEIMAQMEAERPAQEAELKAMIDPVMITDDIKNLINGIVPKTADPAP